MMRKREIDQEDVDNAVPSNVTPFAVIYFPAYQGFLCEEMLGVVKELACPKAMREAIENAVNSEEGIRVAKAKLNELLYIAS